MLSSDKRQTYILTLRCIIKVIDGLTYEMLPLEFVKTVSPISFSELWNILFFEGVTLCYCKFYKWLWSVLYWVPPISYYSVRKPHGVWDFSSYHIYGKMAFSFLIDNSILRWELWKRQSYKLALINQEEQQETERALKCQCIHYFSVWNKWKCT